MSSAVAAPRTEGSPTSERRPLRIAVHGGLVAGQAGGTQQVVVGLVAALSQLRDGDEEYQIVTYERGYEWLEPYVSGKCTLLPVLPAPTSVYVARKFEMLRPLARRLRDGLALLRGPRAIPLAPEPDVLRDNPPDVVHFPTQNAFVTARPSIYHPWDLLHLNAPQMFTRYQRMYREVVYRHFCGQASIVSVASRWVKNDLVQRYGLAPGKIAVVPMAPVTAAYPDPSPADLEQAREKLALPPRFLYYPAQTYPSKNHLALFEALAILRARHSVEIPLVCSGWRHPFQNELEDRLRKLRLEGQVRFLGFVTPLEIQCLYRTARAMVFPSLSEGWGLPIQEAFASGTPVASSNIMSLPEQIGDAGLLFDPRQPEQIADAIWRLWTDDVLCLDLSARGREMTARYTWDRTARQFRAYYRQLAGVTLGEEDQRLVAAGF